MRWALIVGILFIIAEFYNFFSRTPNIGEGLAGLAIGAVLIILYFFSKKQEQLRNHFLLWLIENKDLLRSRGINYENFIITHQTEITYYQVVLSFLIITLKIPSRFYVVNFNANASKAAIFSFISLIFGWWGIPWGPIYTIQAVIRNLRGGVRQKIEDLLPSN